MKGVIIVTIVDILATYIATAYHRKKQNKELRLLYISLMIGGFLFSQLQTEYLIQRNKRHLKKYR